MTFSFKKIKKYITSRPKKKVEKYIKLLSQDKDMTQLIDTHTRMNGTIYKLTPVHSKTQKFVYDFLLPIKSVKEGLQRIFPIVLCDLIEEYCINKVFKFEVGKTYESINFVERVIETEFKGEIPLDMDYSVYLGSYPTDGRLYKKYNDNKIYSSTSSKIITRNKYKITHKTKCYISVEDENKKKSKHKYSIYTDTNGSLIEKSLVGKDKDILLC